MNINLYNEDCIKGLKRIASILTIAAAMFLLGWWARGARIDVDEEVRVRIDTVYYERPNPIAITSRPVTINVPRLLFAGESCKSLTDDYVNVQATAPAGVDSATTTYGKHCANNAQSPGSCSEFLLDNLSEIPTDSADNIAMALEIETRVYEDSLYQAQVSGPAVGGYRPTLDWIEVYNRTHTVTRTQRPRFAVTAGVGAAYTPRGIQPTVGVQVGVVLWGF